MFVELPFTFVKGMRFRCNELVALENVGGLDSRSVSPKNRSLPPGERIGGEVGSDWRWPNARES